MTYVAPVTPSLDLAERQSLPREPDPYGVYRTVGTAFALLVLTLFAIELLRNALEPSDRDFISFWGAARLALAGNPAAAYDLPTLHALQSAVARFDGGQMPFPYAPAFLLLVVPFAWLPFPAAMALWVAATFLVYMAVATRMFPGSGLLCAALPAVFVNAAIGQNAFVTAALFMGGMVLIGSRPFAAGLILGCLVLKPQLGLLLPLTLVAAGHWRAVAGAALSSVGLMILGVALFGIAATEAWIAQMPLYVEIGRDGLVGWEKLASVYASARQIGLSQEAAFAIHLGVAAAAAGAVWMAWRSGGDPLWRAGVLAAATTLISPYLFLYDCLIFVVPLLWLARSRAPAAAVALLWCLPMLAIAQAYGAPGPVNLNPVVPIALLALLFRYKGEGSSEVPPRAQALA